MWIRLANYSWLIIDTIIVAKFPIGQSEENAIDETIEDETGCYKVGCLLLIVNKLISYNFI